MTGFSCECVKSHKKRRIKVPILVLLLIIIPFLVNEIENSMEGNGIFNRVKRVIDRIDEGIIKEKISGRSVENLIDDSGSVEIFFCPREKCAEKLIELINNSQIIECAFYTIDKFFLESMLNKSNSAKVRIAMDEKMFEKMEILKTPNKTPNKEELSEGMLKSQIIRAVPSRGIMHNKFCIFDSRIVLTGSYNPTDTDSFYNNNNILIIQSWALSEKYEKKFQELWQRKEIEKDYASNNALNQGRGVVINTSLIKSYFCPADSCGKGVIQELERAEENILFLTFSFTDRRISEVLVKKADEGVKIRGVLEGNQISNYSQFQYLKENGIEVKIDNNQYLMHHKIFIIDNKTVISGSYNPTKNANFRNDENLLIINDGKIAEKYLEEFDYVWNARGLLSRSSWKIEDFQETCSRSDSLVLSEIYYNAEGIDAKEEFVELYNPSLQEIDLNHIFLSNNKSRMRLEGVLEAEAVLSIKPKFALNNKHGLLFIFNDSEILDFASWNAIWNLSAEKGKSIQRSSFERRMCKGEWKVDVPSVNKININTT